MDLLQHDSSYLTDPDLHSTSPSSAQLNISPQQSPFDTFEFPVQTHLPHTPSYNGSYQGSPYSGHSDLSFDINEPLNLFDDQFPDPTLREDYDPAEYDIPNTSQLLVFDNLLPDIDSGLTPMPVMPSTIDQRSSHPFDHSSPSSTGGNDSGAEGDSRSRTSSLSSNPHLQSPRVDVAQSFEKMGIRTPNWGTAPLPLDRSISPPTKPQSPPQLLIPDASPGPTFAQVPPTINAPPGDSGAGPQLHIVPATPISTAGNSATRMSFQQRLETLQDTVLEDQQTATPQGWDPHAQPISQHSEQQAAGMGVHRFRPLAQDSYTQPQHSHHEALSGSGPQILPDQHPTSYLYPLPTRMRSKSETSLHHPQWDPTTFHLASDQMSHGDSAIDDGSATIGINDMILPEQSLITPQSNTRQAGQLGLPPLGHNFAFGSASPAQLNTSNGFLSPDFGLRRAKSEAGRSGGHRQSRSEDMTSSTLLFPPTGHGDLMRPQFLHPSESGRGHFRRASSGSRLERPGNWSSSSSQRCSPYPSPSASPRPRYDELPSVPQLASDPRLQEQAQMVVSKPNVTTGRTANASHKRRKQDANFVCPVPGCGSTFTRSFNLKGHLRSHNEEKPFQCKWPGCGKGFARQHDCKRHEQLHSNYRPFTCEGCKKPFARMDALNRHLRSEGGTDCQKMLNQNGSLSNGRAYRPPDEFSKPKLEPDGLVDYDLSGMSAMGVVL